MYRKELKILCLEDVEADAIIVRELLQREGIRLQFDHVFDESGFTRRLGTKIYDIILSDYNMPGFNGIAALLLSKKLAPDTPFICISGTIGEDLAVEMMHMGASDYILKDKLSKLPVAIERSLKTAEEHLSRLSAEKSLQESEARFRDILMSSNDWVWEVDAEGKYCYVSNTVGNLLGYTEEEVLGKTPFDFMPPDERESVGRVFFEIAAKRSIIKDLENWNIHKSGRMVCMLTNGFPVFDENNNLTGYRGVDKDITDRKLAENEIRKLSMAIEQSPVSVLIADRSGKISYANPAVMRLTGYSFRELAGKNIINYSYGNNHTDIPDNLWQTIGSGTEWRGELHSRKKNGEMYWESASISPIHNDRGELTHFLAIKEDITERKQLTNDLIEAKQKAEASDRLKTAFLNNISHEVRTPLNGILGFAEFLTMPDIRQPEKEYYLEILNDSSERLVKTITSYMDMSLLVSGNMSVNPGRADLARLIDNVSKKYSHKCQTKNLKLKVSVPEDHLNEVVTDVILVEKALFHLMDNAVKFTEEGIITLGIRNYHSGVELFVKDTGLGIDPGARSSIFKIFMQEDVSGTRSIEGSGLGLSITMGIVELLGGKIRLESEKGKGSVFILSLPGIQD